MVVMWGLATTMAITACGQTTAPNESTTRAEIVQAIRRSSLDGFAGTVRFTVDYWQAAGGDEDGRQGKHSAQDWRTTTDGSGLMRARIDWPPTSSPTSSPTPTHFGRTDLQNWLLMDQELLIHDHAAVLNDPDLDGRVMIMQNLIRQADVQLERILGAVVPTGPVRVAMIDGTSAQPTAVVEVNDVTTQVTFDRTDGVLLPSSVIRSDDEFTYKWTYSGYHRLGDRWTPMTVELQQTNSVLPGQSLRCRYSQIHVTSTTEPEDATLKKMLAIPAPGDTSVGQVVIVTTVTTKGVSYLNGFGVVEEE